MSHPPSRADVAGRTYHDLRRQARQQGRATDEYLRLYALEGMMARISASPHRATLVVKGGALLAAYGARRPTADVDLAARAAPSEVEEVRDQIFGIAGLHLDDGLIFDTSTATAVAIRDDDEYPGVRVSLTATLATAKLALHIDVNVGDPIWPAPEPVRLPRLLGGEINVLGYPVVMILAEKLVTAGQRGTANTRWRDFADIYTLTSAQDVLSDDAHRAITIVASHRRSDLVSLRAQLDGYAEIAQTRWAAWRTRQALDDHLPLLFAEVLERTHAFADGCYVALTAYRRWSPSDRAWVIAADEQARPS